MPPINTQPPELNDAAAGELIPANQQLSASRGQLNLWVLRVSLFVVVALAGVIWVMYSNEKSTNEVHSKQQEQEIIFWRNDSKAWQDKYVGLLLQNQVKLNNLQDTTTILKKQIQ